MDGQDRPVVKVYVRKGHDADHRRLSFQFPPTINKTALMGAGFAIDGNQAVRVLRVEHLLEIELDLARSLSALGYQAEFV
jgi:hypothetical protein